jgi:hypothetical protein
MAKLSFHLSLLLKRIRTAQSVGRRVTGWTVEDSGFNSQQDKTYFSSRQRPDRLWVSLPKNIYRDFPPGDRNSWIIKRTTHLKLVPTLRMCGAIHPLPHTSTWKLAQSLRYTDYFDVTLLKENFAVNNIWLARLFHNIPDIIWDAEVVVK